VLSGSSVQGSLRWGGARYGVGDMLHGCGRGGKAKLGEATGGSWREKVKIRELSNLGGWWHGVLNRKCGIIARCDCGWGGPEKEKVNSWGGPDLAGGKAAGGEKKGKPCSGEEVGREGGKVGVSRGHLKERAPPKKSLPAGFREEGGWTLWVGGGGGLWWFRRLNKKKILPF